ncbi:uncharacterized protein N7518_002390 [Penicillium psychrosexuale]|uniref:uncharacterized protein n=1 Tax=Penicillium psychrosexuale TaxID=1002107 RepID=UPI002545B9A1|nr:uncharacterized protein N7518_002390 [Penicillium psychrosexuale]KAJ5800322.1 hypothetical protein N7518_002390 [Penicillium psychrosexuale]
MSQADVRFCRQNGPIHPILKNRLNLTEKKPNSQEPGSSSRAHRKRLDSTEEMAQSIEERPDPQEPGSTPQRRDLIPRSQAQSHKEET